MEKNFRSAEEVMGDEWFLAWYFKQDAQKIKHWESWLIQNRGQQPLVEDAVLLMKEVYLEESPVPETQAEAAFTTLSQTLDKPVPATSGGNKKWLIIAAIVLLVIAMIAYFLLRG